MYSRSPPLMGVLLCGICFWRDSQEEKQSNLRLQKAIETIYGDIDRLNQERMYELPIALVIVNEDGQICWYNQYFDRNFKKKDTTANFFGKKIQEELGINLESLLKEKNRSSITGRSTIPLCQTASATGMKH